MGTAQEGHIRVKLEGMLVVTVERNRHLQAHTDRTHAEIVLPSQVPREGSLQRLWKEHVVHDEDQKVIGKAREPAGKVTILRTLSPVLYVEVDLSTAVTCGFKTTQGLQESWVVLHPRAQFVGVVWFVLGDWRDQSRYLNFTGSGGGDYTSNRSRAMDPDAPVPDDVAEDFVSQNRQKDEARRAAAAIVIASETYSERLRRLNRYIEQLRVTVGEEAARQAYSSIRQHIRVVEQRVTRAEKRK